MVSENYRLINFLEEYCFSTGEVINILDLLEKKPVFIVGLGGVGSWVVDILARSGIRNFILVDNDKVELSNLHRQDFFTENDVGKFKIDCIEKKLQNISKFINCKKYYKALDDSFFDDFYDSFCCAINCADFPNVDKTTQIIGDKCMKENIPHIVGGGYNLHLSLIGESIIPYKSACYQCFSDALEDMNKITGNLVKLRRSNRKIGSFTPLCTINASLVAIEAFKILCGFYNRLTNLNQRIEFKIRTMNIERKDIRRNPKCRVCGQK
ncbi:HesA/MoeB/ThiF family protein [Campylobacter sp. CNRCH_2016_0050h]|uniref:HesA/MoeB/ThiF family protein n=1 Tax=Campylobacter sp. CNRCH_2016_0050h TaxID=2911608 RepID=UPI0021E6B85E|nr:ThiF family adenylyltransferase [Campylobacter sp. CNRCH_2016_0050h]MCV3457102.1 ThiF family adenylyltransferase [Campylobacter sp. CNRCH_2016_0050h]